MDNKPVEYKAKLLIAQKLLKLDLLVTDPFFDIQGSDLLVFKEVGEKVRLGIIQSKGRTIKKDQGSNIKIPKKYLTNHFVVFLYVELKENKNEYLYCFFSDEISKWESDEKYFNRTIPINFFEQDNFKNFTYDENRENRIINIFEEEEEDLSIKQIIKQYELIEQVYNEWAKFNIFPSLDHLNIILNKTDFSKTTIEQDLLVYITIFIRLKEYEKRFDEFDTLISFEFLLSTFGKFSNTKEQIINEDILINAKNIIKGIHNWYGPFNKYLIAEIELLINEKKTKGIYCLIRDSEGDGVEMYLAKDDETGFLINNLSLNAKKKTEEAIEILNKKT